MNQTELIRAVAARTDATQGDTALILGAVLATISQAVAAGDDVKLLGFGTFSPAVRPARTARNPRTGSPVDVPETITVRFRAGAHLKQLLNKRGGAR